MRILVAGTGFTGSRILKRLLKAGHEVWGMNRSGEFESGIPVVKGDVLARGGLKALPDLPEMDLLISTLSGTGYQDPDSYRALYVDGPRRILEAVRWKQNPHVWMLGSTGVYGVEGGNWVDEETPTEPLHRSGKVQVEAEQALRSACDETCILRLSGLYGPGRTRLIRQALRKRPFLKPELWANQIHADDVAGFVGFLVNRELPPPGLLLVSDKEPAQRKDIFSWIREEMKQPEGMWDEDHPQRAGMNRGNKRVNSAKLQALGYKLKYPTYREGLSELLGMVQG